MKKRDKQEVEQVHMFLNKIAEPEKVHTATERMQYTKLRERLGEASDNRNPLALSILQASTNTTSQEETLLLKKQLVNAANNDDPLASYIVSTLLSSSELLREDVNELYHELVREQKIGDKLAATILVKLRKQQRRNTRNRPLSLPKQNRIQQVSLDDYEAVKNMWYDNYLHAEVPPDSNGKPQTRIGWIQSDMAEITETINLLSSQDSDQQQEGMERVSTILPFLLIGGFTQQEVLGYLKAKFEAGKMALITLQKSEDEESQLVLVSKKEENTQKAVQEFEIPMSEEKGEVEKDNKKSVN